MADTNGALGRPQKGRYSSVPIHRLMREPSGKTETPCCFWTRVICISFTIVLLMLGVTTSIIMLGTNVFDETLLESLILRNNTKMFEWWQKPPVTPYIQVRLFNYTNWEAMMENGSTPNVEEIGPYTFLQHSEKREVRFNDDATVTYQEHTAFAFQPQLSYGGQDDVVFLPNVPFLSAVSVLRDSSTIKQITMAIAINSVNPPPFLRFSAKEYLWGYKETLTQLAKAFSVVDIDPESLKLGILEARAGTTRDAVTVETGARDIDRLGLIADVGGRQRLDAWGNTSCSRMDGSDGYMFPPRLVRERRRLYVFTKDMCRRLALDFNSTEIVHGMKAFMYKPPDNVFGTPEENQENECFCPLPVDVEEPSCPYGGVFSVGPCNFGAPVLVSFPHFYGGDDQLHSFVNGLKPDPVKHGMYLYIHPFLGVPMGGKTRFQMNVKVRKVSKIPSVKFFQEGAVLPIAWIEIGVDELPEEVADLLYKASFTDKLKLIIICGSGILAGITLIILLCCLFKWWVLKLYRHSISQDVHILEPL